MVTVKSIIDVLALTYIEKHNPLVDFPLFSTYWKKNPEKFILIQRQMSRTGTWSLIYTEYRNYFVLNINNAVNMTFPF